MRAPAVAGSFYPASPDALRRQLLACFDGALPAVGRARRIRALVAPHAGYVYSGRVAAAAYRALAEDGRPQSVVIVGPQHGGVGLVTASAQDWRTPLGDALVDRELLQAILDAGPIVVDERAHAREHSLEVQLPFLQTIFADAPPFVALAMGLQDEETAREAGEAIARAIRATGRDAVVVASSDLSHVGPGYDVDAPPGVDVAAHARSLDARWLDAAERLDPDALLDAVRRHGIPSCGHGPVAAAMHAARAMGATRVRRIAYATSHDVRPHDSVVGYAALVLE